MLRMFYYLGSGLSGTSVPPCGLKYSLTLSIVGLSNSPSTCTGFFALRCKKQTVLWQTSQFVTAE